MDAELKERMARLCEARRNHDNARAHLSSVVERGEFGAVRDSQAAERDALVALLTAVTMACVAAGESLGVEGASLAEVKARQFEENFVHAAGELAESLSLVEALAERLEARLSSCQCTTRVCAECLTDEALLAKVKG